MPQLPTQRDLEWKYDQHFPNWQQAWNHHHNAEEERNKPYKPVLEIIPYKRGLQLMNPAGVPGEGEQVTGSYPIYLEVMRDEHGVLFPQRWVHRDCLPMSGIVVVFNS